MSPSNSATPAELGYRMPAEWEPHQATWISWPHKEASWPGKIHTIFPTIGQMVAHLSRSETVHINIADDAMEQFARQHIESAGELGEIVFHRRPTNDAWCRDHGAIFLKSTAASPSGTPPLAATDWKYNAWGDKYPPYDLDNAVPKFMADFLGLPRFEIDMVLEGGSIEVNGTGTLLTSEACLLNPNRNPELSRDQIEENLRRYLGVQQILWLGDGIIGDDTDGHIDDLARFVSENTIITTVETDPEDENFEILQENLERLKSMRNPAGKSFKILTLPMPPAVIYEEQRLPATYANFYIANKVVLVPGYHPETDEQAKAILQPLFPGRKVVVLDCTDVIWGLGAFHCLTQQIPA